MTFLVFDRNHVMKKIMNIVNFVLFRYIIYIYFMIKSIV